MSVIELRPVEDADHDLIFEMMRDPEAVAMAAFTAQDPDDRAAFEAHLRKVRANPEATLRAITSDGALAGTIASFVMEGDTEITYWVDRARWGQGVASRALDMFLRQVSVWPVFARAATDNVGSLRVLEKAGFRVVGSEVSHANARGRHIEETILKLPGGPDQLEGCGKWRWEPLRRQMRPVSWAHMATSTRFRAPSFRMRLARWALTVLGVM